MTPEERRLRLEAARKALLTDDPQALLRALAMLPHDGEKAADLRTQLSARLSVGHDQSSAQAERQGRPATESTQELSPPHGPVGVWSGGASSPLVRTAVRGGEVEIRINSDHPIFPYLTRNGTLDDAASLLLLGWARLELDAGGKRRLESIRDMMSDWSRALAQIARSREGSR